MACGQACYMSVGNVLRGAERGGTGLQRLINYHEFMSVALFHV